ncbi:flavin reductase [Muricauda sp. JGD-17]|uniref:Flavin reductase n=1 Tax=Flagellimonas ochracea TaxID=2696472 RepID=A0A964TAL2_9FLAO|nr:flavin reductase [Allomuricauda ochracea]NAY91332.1 flavin reductase [Allomuricauda ochracea]
MDTLKLERFTSLDLGLPIWDRIFTIAPLVAIGTKEGDGYDMAPKHMAMPMGWDHYFGFVCTPKHGTYQNIKSNGRFTVSFPKPDQIVFTSLSASPRLEDISKSKGTLSTLPLVQAVTMDAPLLRDAYLYLECELYKIIDGFNENSLITGTIKAAHAHNDYLRVFEKDEREQLQKNPLLAYIAPNRYAKIGETYTFPFPKDFKK